MDDSPDRSTSGLFLRRTVTIVWIHEAVISRLMTESRERLPKETGGVLLGYWGGEEEVVITDVVGPGASAVHERDRFIPDHDFHDAEVARAYQESRGSITYLGDWHSHGEGAPYLSVKDRRTLYDIASDPDSRAPNPLMVVLGRSPEWEVGVWVFKSMPLARWTYRWCPEPCSIRTFE